MEGVQIDHLPLPHPQEKLPSKRPALLGLIKEKIPYIKHSLYGHDLD